MTADDVINKGMDPVWWATNATPEDVQENLVKILREEKNIQVRYNILKTLTDRANSEPSEAMAITLHKIALDMSNID